MVNYSCEKCGKEFSQKGHYTKHLNRKNPCVVESKVKEMLDKVVEEKLNNLTKNNNNNEKITICVLFLKIFERSFPGKKPPDEIIVNAKLRALKLLIEIKFKIININKVKPE